MLESMSNWVESRLQVLSWCVIALAFALRLQAAIGTYLNPDEALHVLLSNQHNPVAVYRKSLTNAHPPLFFLALYFWRWLGTSEVALRMLPVLAGTAAAWIASRWVTGVLGRTAGFASLLMLSFSPFLITLHAELRSYAALLLFMSSALYWVERLFRAPSPQAAGWLGLFLALSALTHYSAAWFVAALGVYVLLRWRDLPHPALTAWAASQLGLAALYGVLYVKHLSKLHGSAMEVDAADGWLRSQYFRPESQSVFGFVVNGTVSLFQVLFSHRYLGDAAMLLCLAGGLWIIAAGLRRSKGAAPAAFGLLLFLPFGLNAIGALLRVYPYGGSRHSVFLILFAAAGASFAITKVVRERSVWVLATAIFAVPYWHLHAVAAPQQAPRSQQERDLMTEAIAYLRDSAPAGSPIMTDYQSSLLLMHYLGGDAVPPPSTACGGLFETALGGYRLITSARWSATAGDFQREVGQWRAKCGSAGPVWVFDGGWRGNLIDDISRTAPDSFSRERRFGPALSVFELRR
jgi:hypothetical protein